MRPLFSLLAVVCCLAGCATSRDVVVGKLGHDLPSDENARGTFLWYRFANKHAESKFGSQTTKGWEDKYDNFSRALVNKAESKGFDSVSLAKILQLIYADSNGVAYLPVGAYQTNLGADLVWIVVVKWEGPGKVEGRWLTMQHVRMYAFKQGDLEKVAFKTCM